MSKVVNTEAKHTMVWDNVLFMTYHCEIGQGIAKHSHPYSHATQCHAGSIKLSKEGISVVLTPEHPPIKLLENEWHEIEALEESTVFVNILTEGKA